MGINPEYYPPRTGGGSGGGGGGGGGAPAAPARTDGQVGALADARIIPWARAGNSDPIPGARLTEAPAARGLRGLQGLPGLPGLAGLPGVNAGGFTAFRELLPSAGVYRLPADFAMAIVTSQNDSQLETSRILVIPIDTQVLGGVIHSDSAGRSGAFSVQVIAHEVRAHNTDLGIQSVWYSTTAAYPPVTDHYKGAWSRSRGYAIGDMVAQGVEFYIAVAAHSGVNNPPSPSNRTWKSITASPRAAPIDDYVVGTAAAGHVLHAATADYTAFAAFPAGMNAASYDELNIEVEIAGDNGRRAYHSSSIKTGNLTGERPWPIRSPLGGAFEDGAISNNLASVGIDVDWLQARWRVSFGQSVTYADSTVRIYARRWN